jgi:uncharacterized iron-regulated membrane protein
MRSAVSTTARPRPTVQGSSAPARITARPAWDCRSCSSTAATGGCSAIGCHGGTAGDIFLQVQFPLHSGRIAGLPGRILISAMGLAVAILSVTGVVIWLRKRSARLRPRTVAELSRIDAGCGSFAVYARESKNGGLRGR